MVASAAARRLDRRIRSSVKSVHSRSISVSRDGMSWIAAYSAARARLRKSSRTASR